jgi:glycine/sarcosine N-methyltransferase
VTDADDVRRAYDDLAADYDRIYPDWRASSRRQGKALHAVLAH